MPKQPRSHRDMEKFSILVIWGIIKYIVFKGPITQGKCLRVCLSLVTGLTNICVSTVEKGSVIRLTCCAPGDWVGSVVGGRGQCALEGEPTASVNSGYRFGFWDIMTYLLWMSSIVLDFFSPFSHLSSFLPIFAAEYSQLLPSLYRNKHTHCT